MAKKFIQKVMSKPGAKGGLHRSIGVPEGQKIPPAKLKAAAKKKGKVGKEARLAETFAKLRKKKK